MGPGNVNNNGIRCLLTGVTDYKACRDTEDLPFVLNDISLMGRAFIQGLKINPMHIRALTGDEGHVTRRDFLSEVSLILQNVEPGDILLFYFSGHGLVKDGKHYLLFSDGALETQSVIDLLRHLEVKSCVLFLDCCMSGDYKMPGPAPLEQNSWIDALWLGGTAVFASSRRNERSGCSKKRHTSLFTTFLFNAMTNRYYVREGNLTLDTIKDLVFQEAGAFNDSHPDRQQHPVFRSSLGGTIYFRVSDYERYKGTHLYPGRDSAGDSTADDTTDKDYIVREISPLHSQKEKRYAVKVILKHAVTQKELILINSKITESVRMLECYSSLKEKMRWSGRPVDVVFAYYGYGEMDAAWGNYAYRTTWAAGPESREKWYREGAHAKVAGGILIDTNEDYDLLKKIADENTGAPDAVRTKTKGLMRDLINRGEALITIYQECVNGEVPEGTMLKALAGTCRDINTLYTEAAELPIPPVELTRWSLLAANVAGDIQDFSLLLEKRSKACAAPDRNPKKEKTEEQKEAESSGALGKWQANVSPVELMSIVVQRFHADLEALQEEEMRST